MLIVTALFFLGASLLDLYSVDLKIAANQRDSMQAYYLAETGLEAALAMLQHYDPYYVGSSSLISEGGNADVDVSASEEADGSRSITILSTGRKGAVRETISLLFQSFPAQQGGVDGAELGWYDPLSGSIERGLHMGEEGTVRLGSPAMALPLTLYHDGEGGSAFFSAGQLYFPRLPISLYLEDRLELESEVIVFCGMLMLDRGAGALVFSHPAAGTVRVYMRDGAVTHDRQMLLRAGVYNFPHGFELSGEMAPGPLTALRVLPLVPGTMVRRDGR